jgi:serine/threonine protein kinase
LSGITSGIASDVLPRRYSSPTLVARGGMGEVYRATDSVLERTVAVKLLSERHAREPEVRARFEREALTAAKLSGNRHVITIFDVGEHEERPYIVMEYLEGGSVHDRLRNGRVPPEQALEWLGQTAEALDKAHASGVVHRDVKPANLLLDREDNIHVSDLGIASTAGYDTLTLPGTILGTAGYLSPEQARGEPATPASDRYALGIVAFELLTGRRPFEADTATTEAFAHVNAPVPSAERLAPDLPEGVDTVLTRALAKNPNDRPKSCAELVADLRAAFRDDPSPALVASPPLTRRMVVHKPRRRSYKAFALGAAVLLLGGLALAGVLGVVRDEGGSSQAGTRDRTGASTTVETTAETTPETTAKPPREDGAELNDRGFKLMQAGDYRSALPLFERAVADLRGSGRKVEAWASYNLAFTRFALGDCAGVIPLLDRSEAIQGERGAIDALRRDAERVCGEDGPGRSEGRGQKKGHED